MSKQSRGFNISSNAIYHLINAQAGSIGKAVLELIQNSGDSTSAEFRLSIDTEGFVAEDDGIGFRSEEEVEKWWEDLGFEHNDDLHQQEGRVGRFGLGRAQIFCFATTVWNTNQFQFDVDVKNNGLEYDLSVAEPYSGCRITGKWYERLTIADLQEVTTEIEQLCAFADIAVIINGRKVNAKQPRWDYETDTVKIKRKESGSLKVYNCGYFVREYPSYNLGSGIVVSKVPLKLNVARTDILTAQCSTWKEVRKFLQSEQTQRTNKKQKLTDDERQFVINSLLSGTADYYSCASSPIIEDVTGRKHPLQRIKQASMLTVHNPEVNKLLSDRLHQSKSAFVLSDTMVDAFNADDSDHLIEKLSGIVLASLRQRRDPKAMLPYEPLENLIENADSELVRLNDKELTKTQLLGLKALRAGMDNLSIAVHYATHERPWEHKRTNRQLFLGDSQGLALGWTNGHTYVVLDRDFVAKNLRDGTRGFMSIINVILHELCHDANSESTHLHSPEFYERFHNTLCGQSSTYIGSAHRAILTKFLHYATKEGLKLSRNELRDSDREQAIENQIYEQNEFAFTISGISGDEGSCTNAA